MKEENYIVKYIKEIVSIMKENNDWYYSNSYEVDDSYIHFKVLDITDYEHNHCGYSVDVKVTNPDNGELLLNYELFYDDMKNSIDVKTVRNVPMDTILEEISKASNKQLA